MVGVAVALERADVVVAGRADLGAPPPVAVVEVAAGAIDDVVAFAEVTVDDNGPPADERREPASPPHAAEASASEAMAAPAHLRRRIRASSTAPSCPIPAPSLGRRSVSGCGRW